MEYLLTVLTTCWSHKKQNTASYIYIYMYTKLWFKTEGEQAFEVIGPKLWSILCEDLSLAESATSFKPSSKCIFLLILFPVPPGVISTVVVYLICFICLFRNLSSLYRHTQMFFCVMLCNLVPFIFIVLLA